MRTKFRSRDRGSGSKNAAVRVATRVFSGSTGIACEIGAGAATISQWGARSTIYDNGPINGTTDAWAINFGFVISDTFTTGGGSVDGMTFGAWLYPGDTLTSAELSITSSPNGGTSYFDQTVTFTQEGCTGNQFGFNVCTVSTSFTGPQLPNGMYWVNLQNASVPSGDPVYWDENSGMGCESNVRRRPPTMSLALSRRNRSPCREATASQSALSQVEIYRYSTTSPRRREGQTA